MLLNKLLLNTFMVLGLSLQSLCTRKYGPGIYPTTPTRLPPIRQHLPLIQKPEVLYSWNLLEYSFPTPLVEEAFTGMDSFNPTNQIPIDVQPHYTKDGKRRVFTTIPRFNNGIPYSLALVSDQNGNNGPLLKPYPDYESHNQDNDIDCNRITSVFRLSVTPCGQMWAIDSGIIGGVGVCPPQLLLFDLETDTLIRRYQFNDALYTKSASIFVTTAVVVKDPPSKGGNCSQTMVYVADTNYPGLVVYDAQRNHAWLVSSPFMHPEPQHGRHTIAGDSFTLMDGIIGLTTDNNNLYFNALASISEYSVPLSILDNCTLYESNSWIPEEQVRRLGQRSSPCVTSAIDRRNNIYCVTFNPIELIVWNINKPYNWHTLRRLYIDPNELEFVSGIKTVVNPQNQEELWLFSNRFQIFANGNINPNEKNYRILKLPLN